MMFDQEAFHLNELKIQVNVTLLMYLVYKKKKKFLGSIREQQ